MVRSGTADIANPPSTSGKYTDDLNTTNLELKNNINALLSALKESTSSFGYTNGAQDIMPASISPVYPPSSSAAQSISRDMLTQDDYTYTKSNMRSVPYTSKYPYSFPIHPSSYSPYTNTTPTPSNNAVAFISNNTIPFTTNNTPFNSNSSISYLTNSTTSSLPNPTTSLLNSTTPLTLASNILHKEPTSHPPIDYLETISNRESRKHKGQLLETQEAAVRVIALKEQEIYRLQQVLTNVHIHAHVCAHAYVHLN